MKKISLYLLIFTMLYCLCACGKNSDAKSNSREDDGRKEQKIIISSIQVASTAELQSKSNLIRKNLNLATETLNNEETRQNRLNTTINKVKWKDPNAFTNYQIFDQNSDTPESGSSNGSS